MLYVGNDTGLNHAEQRTHFALWSLYKSPLMIGHDLRDFSPASLSILLSKVRQHAARGCSFCCSLQRQWLAAKATSNCCRATFAVLHWTGCHSAGRTKWRKTVRQRPTHLSAQLNHVMHAVGAVLVMCLQEVIAINQDDLGVAGDLVWRQGTKRVCALVDCSGWVEFACSLAERLDLD